MARCYFWVYITIGGLPIDSVARGIILRLLASAYEEFEQRGINVVGLSIELRAETPVYGGEINVNRTQAVRTRSCYYVVLAASALVLFACEPAKNSANRHGSPPGGESIVGGSVQEAQPQVSTRAASLSGPVANDSTIAPASRADIARRGRLAETRLVWGPWMTGSSVGQLKLTLGTDGSGIAAVTNQYGIMQGTELSWRIIPHPDDSPKGVANRFWLCFRYRGILPVANDWPPVTSGPGWSCFDPVYSRERSGLYVSQVVMRLGGLRWERHAYID